MKFSSKALTYGLWWNKKNLDNDDNLTWNQLLQITLSCPNTIKWQLNSETSQLVPSTSSVMVVFVWICTGLIAVLHWVLEVKSVCLCVCLACAAASPLTRPDDSSRLHYVQGGASFCLGSGSEKKKNKSTRRRRAGRPKRCSLSIVIIHDRMQFQMFSHHHVGVRSPGWDKRTICFRFVIFGN